MYHLITLVFDLHAVQICWASHCLPKQFTIKSLPSPHLKWSLRLTYWSGIDGHGPADSWWNSTVEVATTLLGVVEVCEKSCPMVLTYEKTWSALGKYLSDAKPLIGPIDNPVLAMRSKKNKSTNTLASDVWRQGPRQCSSRWCNRALDLLAAESADTLLAANQAKTLEHRGRLKGCPALRLIGSLLLRSFVLRWHF